MGGWPGESVRMAAGGSAREMPVLGACTACHGCEDASPAVLALQCRCGGEAVKG